MSSIAICAISSTLFAIQRENEWSFGVDMYGIYLTRSPVGVTLLGYKENLLKWLKDDDDQDPRTTPTRVVSGDGCLGSSKEI